jgi:hypothetical protein
VTGATGADGATGATGPIGPSSATRAAFDQPWSIAGIGDFNGDGKADIAWQNQTTHSAQVQLLNGTTTIGGGIIENSPFDSSWTVVAAGDFNGDGRSDLVYRQTDGLTKIQFLDGNSDIGGGLISNSPIDPSFQVLGAGDFNGDGKADLVWQRPSDGLTEIQLMDGTTPIGGGAITNSPSNQGFSIAGIGDFNGDGNSDLVWHRASDGATEIQFMNGNTVIGGGLLLNSPFGPDWDLAGAGDFNADGKSDLVWHRASDGLTEIQFMDGTNSTGGGLIPANPFGQGWDIAGVGDFNGDGRADLVYRRPSDGLTEIQFLNGTTPIGGGVSSAGAQPLVPLGHSPAF